MESKLQIELFGGKGAAAAAGYDSFPGFRSASLRYPIPDQGYRYNGRPVWTREHLLQWRASVPLPGGYPKKS